MNVIPERLAEIESKPLHEGAGDDIDHACVMQMVSYVAGEPWSDQPQCSCPVLTRMAISLNDNFDSDARQKLRPLVPSLVGTRGTPDDQVARAIFMAWRTVAVTVPIFLDAIGMTEYAAELRQTPRTTEGLEAANKSLTARRDGIVEAAALAAALAAARAAAAAAAAEAAAAWAAAAAAWAAEAAEADKEKFASVKTAIEDSAVETLRLACAVRA